MRGRLRRFSRPIDEANGYEISAPLIAQLGKNYYSQYNDLISGGELLEMACDKVRNIHSMIGGKVAYLECEDHPKLVAFYERHGFIAFDKRSLEKADRNTFHSDHLVQMLRYFD